MRTTNLPKPDLDHMDKVFHCFAYFGLTLSWYLYYFSRKSTHVLKKKALFIICLLSAAFGILIEVFQGAFTTYRSIDAFDALANIAGIVFAFLLVLGLKNRLEKIKRQL